MSFFGKDKDKEEVKEMPVKQTGSLKERLDRINKSRWIRFGIVSALFFGWVAWLGSWWVLVFWFLLFDIYITKFVPWNWWKFSENPIVFGYDAGSEYQYRINPIYFDDFCALKA